MKRPQRFPARVPVRALLLDGFGTLLDWSGPFRRVDEAALKRAHAEADSVTRLPPFDAFHAAYRARREAERAAKAATHEERNYRQRFVDALGDVGLAKRQARVLGERMALRYFRELDQQVRLAPDAPDALAALRALPDVKLALVSNYGDGAGLRRALERLGVLARFDALAVSGEVGVLKPHPRLFQAALADLDVAPAEALMVGDSLVLDVEPSRALGLPVALVANPRAGLRDAAEDVRVAPEGVPTLASLAELPPLVTRLSGS